MEAHPGVLILAALDDQRQERGNPQLDPRVDLLGVQPEAEPWRHHDWRGGQEGHEHVTMQAAGKLQTDGQGGDLCQTWDMDTSVQ